ncbi:exlusion protein FxsA [Ruegeria sp. ANG-R]|uniref:FxsA family protein n=1 Tax=Ruegeria sp. ANG-R TaxID=1577903 RepID=UPI00057F4D84|nr:FxsA family protein [Ruegeria sp. ANG-R]KIC38435.1 exlusion protein FxsA [Ruegeria sp. ANG-R]
MYLFLAFLLVPIIEIALFIQVGGLIGLWPTLAIVVLTAVLGTVLVRTQGRMALANLQRSFAELDDPTEPLAHGAMILLSGVLLLTPGFFTDAIGFALLIPGIRVAVFRYLKSKATITHFQMGTGAQFRSRPNPFDNDDVIDGEYTEVRPRQNPEKPSKWVEGPQ